MKFATLILLGTVCLTCSFQALAGKKNNAEIQKNRDLKYNRESWPFDPTDEDFDDPLEITRELMAELPFGLKRDLESESFEEPKVRTYKANNFKTQEERHQHYIELVTQFRTQLEDLIQDRSFHPGGILEFQSEIEEMFDGRDGMDRYIVEPKLMRIGDFNRKFIKLSKLYKRVRPLKEFRDVTRDERLSFRQILLPIWRSARSFQRQWRSLVKRCEKPTNVQVSTALPQASNEVIRWMFQIVN